MMPRDAFPLGSIPQPLRGMALTFSHRYVVPPSHAVMAMLGAIGAAVGNQIEFEPWPGQRVHSCINVLFASQAYQAAVDAVWAPLLSAQRAQVKGLVLDAESLDREAERLTRERDQYVERIPSQSLDLRYFDERLADLQLARCPVVTIDPAGIEATGHTAVLLSPGGSALAIDRWVSEAGARERDLLVAGWNQRADSRTCQTPSGSVSVTMVASPDDANRLLTDRWAARSGLAGTFLVVRDDEAAAPVESAASGADQWADWLRRLFHWRHAGNTMMCHPAPEARRNLDELALELVSLAGPEPHRNLGSWHQQALRLTLLLHLGTGNLQPSVAPETVRAAVALTRWLVGQQADLLAEPADAKADRLEGFVRSLVPTAGAWMTVTQSYDAFAQQCRQLGIVTPSRKDYTGRVTDLVEQIHGFRLRKDVPGLNGKHQAGWCGLGFQKLGVPVMSPNTQIRRSELSELSDSAERAEGEAAQIEFLI